MRKLSILALVLAAVFTLGSANAAALDNKYLEYNLSNSCPADDTSGNNYDGTCNGGVQTGVSGIYGDAYNFTGDGYLDTGQSYSGTDISISAWVKFQKGYNFDHNNPDLFSEDSDEMIFGGYDGSNQIRLAYSAKGNELDFYTYDGSKHGVEYNWTNEVQADTWYHIVGIYDSSITEYRLYINDTQVASASDSTFALPTYDNYVGAGKRDSGAYKPFNGTIDQFKVFSDALTDSEVNQLYTEASSDSGNSNPSLSTPSPSDGSSSVSTSTNLSIDYSDSDGDSGTVTFYWQNGTQIQQNTGVSSGSTTSTSSLSLSSGTTYNWYVEASDGNGGSISAGNYSFTTQSSSSTTGIVLDDFEDGDISEYSGNTADFSAITSNSYSGSYGVRKTSNRGTSTRIYNSSFSYDIDGNNITIRVRPNEFSTDFAGVGWSTSAGSGYYAGIHTGSSYFGIDKYTGSTGNTDGTLASESLNVTLDNWYKIVLNKDGSTYTAWLLDDAGNVVNGPVSASDSTYSPSTFGIQQYSNQTRNPMDYVTLEGVSTEEPSLTNPSPNDEALAVSTSTDLCIDYSDPQGQNGDITFTWQNGTQIQQNTGVSSGTTSCTSSLSLSSETSYSWQVEATDSDGNTVSAGNYSFTTKGTPPVWRNLGQEFDSISLGNSNTLFAEGQDNGGLAKAFLSTNESGRWRNYTDGFLERNGNDYFTSNSYSVSMYDMQEPAMWYVPSEKKTFFVYQGETGNDPHISYYNHRNQSFVAQQKVADNTLTTDNHGAPALSINESNGEICVYFGSHSTSQPYSCNNGGFNISSSSWTTYSSFPGSDNTYPHPRIYNGKEYVIIRDSTENPTHWSYTSTSDRSGGSWSSKNTFISSDGARDFYLQSTPNILEPNDVASCPHFPFSSSKEGADVYAGYLCVDSGNVYSFNGTNLGSIADDTEQENFLKVAETNSDLSTNVYKGERYRMLGYEDGNYYISYPVNRSSESNERIKFAQFNSSLSDWEIIDTSIDNYPRAGLTMHQKRMLNKSSFELYTPRYDTSDVGGEVFEKWLCTDYGHSCSFEETIWNSTKQGTDPIDFPHVPYQSTDELKVEFQERIRNNFNADEKIWMWGELHDSPQILSGQTSYVNTSFEWDNSLVDNDEVGWKIWYEDSSGLYNSTDSLFFTVSGSDSTPPTSSDNYTASAFVDKTETVIELTASDSGSGVEDIYYRVNGGSYTVKQGSSATVTINTQGNNTLEYYAEDSAGNVEATNTEYVALESNSAPTASFTTTTTDLELGVDASGSSDSDGTISELAWDWTNDGNFETVKDESQKQGQFYNVEVVSTSNGNKYLLNGTQQKNIDLEKGVNHTFNLTSSVQTR